MMADRWAENRGVRLHFVDYGADAPPESGLPLLCVPGAAGAAEMYSAHFEALAPRRCLSLSLRGRGRSDAPPAGYTFEDQVSDVEAVAESAGLDRLCLMGYSLGAAFALGYALRHPQRVAGLIVGDYPARYPAFTAEWVERALAGGMDALQPGAAQAIQRESCEVLLWDSLGRITCPVLIMRGDQPDSLLSEADAQRYLRSLPMALLTVFEGSGHVLWMPDSRRFVGAIRLFLAQVDVMEHRQ